MQKNKLLWQILKWVIILASYGFIGFKIYEYINDERFERLDADEINYFCLAAALLLMPLNYFMDGLKWRLLILKFENISILNSFKSAFIGMTFGIFTPNRLGEFGGRLYYLQKQNRVRGILVTSVSKFGNILIIDLFGLIAYAYAHSYYDINLIKWDHDIFTLFAVIIVVVLNLSLFIVRYTYPYFIRLPYLRRFKEQFVFMRNFSASTLLQVQFMGFLRYLVFLSQFFLLLLAFHSNLPPFQTYLLISVIYFALTFIPTFSMAEIGIRGSLSILILEPVLQNSIVIFMATACIWIVNLALPALIGSVFISSKKRA